MSTAQKKTFNEKFSIHELKGGIKNLNVKSQQNTSNIFSNVLKHLAIATENSLLSI